MKMVKKPVYIIDMDGTLYHGTSPIEHAKEFVRYLQKNHRKFLFVTNCSGSSPIELVAKLAGMDIKITEENILTSGQVTASFVANNTIASRVYVIGSRALKEELVQHGVQVVRTKPDCVIVGFDKSFHFNKMKAAVNFILDGAKFIVTNDDSTIPDGHSFLPHTGAIAAGIERATGIKPLVIGKPETYILSVVQQKLHCSLEECAIIGDRLDTDIALGTRLGIPSYLVMTGVTSYDMVKQSSIQPTKIFDHLKELLIYDRDILS